MLSALTTVHGGLLNATAGTVSAQVALIPDVNKDLTGLRNLTLTGNLTVQGTTTTVNTVTMEAANAIVFEGATADDNETTLTIIDPNADRTIKLPNQSGCLPVLAADSSTAITATPEEINILDGVTATAAELNILDGVTSTAAELNILDGVTSTAAELNILDGVTATAAELNYVDGVTSAIQTQIDGKYATSGGELTGSVTITTGFPDLTLKSNGERRLLFSDGGGSANAGLKYASSELQFVYGGVASGDVEMKMTNGAIDIINSLKIGGVAITSTAAELNILDGVTATAAELNILDGVTSTAAELNILDGVTSTAAELNILDGVTSTAAELNLLDGVTATTAELNYVDGVTSNIQTQLDALQTADAELTELATMASTAAAAIADLTAAEIQILDGATVTTAELNILDGVTSTAAELNILDGVTSTAAELNILDGVTSTAAELNILDGVTSTAAELNLVDGITAGTVSASLAVIADSNKDVTGFRNVTLTGELDAATLDISGDADIDGTANLDVVDIDGAVDIGSGSVTLSAATAVFLTDNTNQALTIAEAGNAYVQFQTNNGSEKVLCL